MAPGNGFSTLSRKHGIRVSTGSPCSVEDVALAVGGIIGHTSVKSAARMNKAVVLFVERVDQVHKLVEEGLTVNGLFVPVMPLTQPTTRVTLSNVPPFISDEFLCKELSKHGKIVSPIKKVLSGCKSPLLKHVVSHRRQVFMILNNREHTFDYRFVVRVEGFDYILFATSCDLKCFGCGEEGHMVRACPARAGSAPADPAEPRSASGHGSADTSAAGSGAARSGKGACDSDPGPSGSDAGGAAAGPGDSQADGESQGERVGAEREEERDGTEGDGGGKGEEADRQEGGEKERGRAESETGEVSREGKIGGSETGKKNETGKKSMTGEGCGESETVWSEAGKDSKAGEGSGGIATGESGEVCECVEGENSRGGETGEVCERAGRQAKKSLD